jgi:hypothetical protein
MRRRGLGAQPVVLSNKRVQAAQLVMSPPGLSHRRLHAESLDAVCWRANAAFGADSLSDTAPLRELIAKYITAETLKRIAAAYYDNRHLVIGTTNID